MFKAAMEHVMCNSSSLQQFSTCVGVLSGGKLSPRGGCCEQSLLAQLQPGQSHLLRSVFLCCVCARCVHVRVCVHVCVCVCVHVYVCVWCFYACEKLLTNHSSSVLFLIILVDISMHIPIPTSFLA